MPPLEYAGGAMAPLLYLLTIHEFGRFHSGLLPDLHTPETRRIAAPCQAKRDDVVCIMVEAQQLVRDFAGAVSARHFDSALRFFTE